MPSTKLKLDTPNRNIDSSTPSTNCLLVQDGYIDSSGAFHRRPGLSTFVDLSTSYPDLVGVGGLGQYWWQSQSMNIVVFGSRVFKITDNLGTVVELLGATLDVNRRVTFAECWDLTKNQTLLFMSNGGNLIYTDGNSLFTASGATLPTRVSHVLSIDTYIAVNDLDFPTIWHYSGKPGYPTDWTVSPNNYSTKNINDSISFMDNFRDKVIIQGSRTTEFWQDTGDASPFSPLIGATSHVGCVNPYSYSKLDNDAVFFASSRDVVALAGYEPQIISQSYANEFQSLGVVADAESDFINSIGGRKYYMVSFPDSGRTIVYNNETNSFSEWGSYNGDSYDIFVGHCYTYANDWGKHLILDKNNPYVYIMSPQFFDDAGTTMKTQIITGWYDHGTSERKRSNNLKINVKRGTNTITTSRTISVSHITYSGQADRIITSVINGGAEAYVFATGLSIAFPEDIVFSTTNTDYNGINHTLFSGTYARLDNPVIPYSGNATGYFNKALSPLLITTSSAHGLLDGDEIFISGTVNYNGTYTISLIDDNNFTINATFVLDEASLMTINVNREYSPKLYLNFRDDGNLSWSDDIELDLGTTGNSNTPIEIRGIGGIYSQRQYKFTFGDNADLSINSIEEDVELMV